VRTRDGLGRGVIELRWGGGVGSGEGGVDARSDTSSGRRPT
jgi:hypothetical protein